MERTVRAGEGQAYAVAVASLWERIGSVLVRLERIADSPPDLVESDLLEELPGLQYRLHSGAELAVGIDPPPAAAGAHADLVGALAEARDATAEIAGALETGDPELIQALLPGGAEASFACASRGSGRSSGRSPRPGQAVGPVAAPPAARSRKDAALGDRRHGSRPRGALLFTAGAVLVAWPLWAAGLALFAGGFILYRP